MTKSKIFFYLCLAFLGGIFISSFVFPGFFEEPSQGQESSGLAVSFSSLLFPVYFILTFSLILIFIWWKNPKVVLFGFCLIFFLFGFLRFGYEKIKTSQIELSQFYEKEIIFEGTVVREPQKKEKNLELVISVEKIKAEENKNNSLKTRGYVLATLPFYPEYKYGDRLKISGELKEPVSSNGFSYRDCLARYEIFATMYYPQVELLAENQGNFSRLSVTQAYTQILKIKTRFKESLDKIISEPHSSFLAALLLGMKKSLPEDLAEHFNLTGTRHIMAISGYHVSVVSALVISLLSSFLARRLAFSISIIFIIFYVILTGAGPSVVRAGIMGSLVLVALNSGRLSDVKNSLLCAASFMLLLNPMILRFDVGFQLSFLATLGIVYLTPYLEKLFKKLPEFLQIRKIFAVTCAAQIAVLPLVIFHFKKITLIAPLANLAILPFIPWIMMIGFLAGLGGLIWTFLGKIIAWGAWILLSYVMFILGNLSKIPYAYLELKDFWFGFVVLYYVLFFALIIWLKRRERIILLRKKSLS